MGGGSSRRQAGAVMVGIVMLGVAGYLFVPRPMGGVPEPAAGVRDAAVDVAEDDILPDASPELPPSVEPAPTVTEALATIPTSDVAVPTLDLVRIDGRGATVVAGSGAADSDVVLRIDGEEMAAVRTDSTGNFVALFETAPADVPRVLTVETRDAAGAVVRAAESVIVSPSPAPETPVADGGGATIADASTDAGSASPGSSTAGDDSGDQMAAVAIAPPPADTPDTLRHPDGDAPPDATRPAAGAPARAAAPPRLFRAGPDGVSVLSDADTAPEARTRLGIDAITYDAEGEVQLAGRGEQNSNLRIYLNNRPVTLAQVDADGGWKVPLENVESGVYTLRIDALDAAGAVTARVETPFERTAPAIAAAARRDGASAITVQPGFTLWAISEGYFGDGIRYVQIFEANRSQIRDPDLIFPGQIFALPDAEN